MPSPPPPPLISQERNFPRTRGLRGRIDNNKTLRFRPFSAKTNDSVVRKSLKTLFWTHFRCKPPNWGRIGFLLKIRALSLFYIYWHLTSYKISEKSNEQILRKRLSDERTNREKRTDGPEFIGPVRFASGPIKYFLKLATSQSTSLRLNEKKIKISV